MSYCPNCGFSLGQNYRYCPECGILVNENDTAIENTVLDRTVRINSRIIVVGPATYLLNDIKSATVKKIEKSKTETTFYVVLGGALIGMVWGFADSLSDLDGWDYLTLLIAIGMILFSIINSVRNVLYSVDINTSFGDSSIHMTKDKETAQRIVNAINKQIQISW